MHLCDVCTAIIRDNRLEDEGKYNQHRTISSFIAASDQKCHFCSRTFRNLSEDLQAVLKNLACDIVTDSLQGFVGCKCSGDEDLLSEPEVSQDDPNREPYFFTHLHFRLYRLRTHSELETSPILYFTIHPTEEYPVKLRGDLNIDRRALSSVWADLELQTSIWNVNNVELAFILEKGGSYTSSNRNPFQIKSD